jgi:predicted nucleotidyltransferase component of viral defense system
MIPLDFITEWRKHAPWPQNNQVEQDLILSRAIVEMFQQKEVKNSLAFRGGTALYKLNDMPPARYSEDIDLVQLESEPIGEVLNAMRKVLDPWLGTPKWVQKDARVVLKYKFESEDLPPIPMRLKIEINSREHFTVYGVKDREFSVDSRWFKGSAMVKTYQREELLGTKLRALYQRRKSRDLFDLWITSQRTSIDPVRVVECFYKYIEHDAIDISRAQFEENFRRKLTDPIFGEDIEPLLAAGIDWKRDAAEKYVLEEILPLMKGDPWKGGTPE